MKANAPKRKVFADAMDLLTDSVSTSENDVQMIAVDAIRPFRKHPFRLYEGERLEEMVESIKEHGVLVPAIVLQTDDGYPNSHKLICPYCGKFLRRRYVYNKKVEWICATYIHKGKAVCKGIRVRESELTGRIFTEPTVVEEVVIDGSKHYCYTSKTDYDNGVRATDCEEKEGCSILPRVNRSRRTVIKL